MCFKRAAATVLLMCGPFCACAARSAHVRPVLPAESFDPDPFFRWKVLFRYVLFVAACYIYGQSVRSSLQSVSTGLPAKSSHYGKNGPAENLRWHLSSQVLMCGPFCQRKVLIPIRSSDGKFSSGMFCSLRPVTFMDSLSVPLCSPFRRVCQQKVLITAKTALRRT